MKQLSDKVTKLTQNCDERNANVWIHEGSEQPISQNIGHIRFVKMSSREVCFCQLNTNKGFKKTKLPVRPIARISEVSLISLVKT